MGDDILWYDHVKQASGTTKVTAVLGFLKRAIWQIKLDDETILFTTKGQRFHSLSRAQAFGTSELLKGDRVPAFPMNKTLPERTIVEVAATDLLQTVYNLKTAAPHKFIVGLAHAPIEQK